MVGQEMARKKTYGEKIADHIAAVVEARNIEHVLHFTLLDNLPGILSNGLLSRSILREADYAVFASDADRLDGEDGAISVSISCFYPKMFDAKRFRSGNAPWVILAFDPSLLWNYHCLFYRNGASTNATKYEHGKRYGGFALERLFDDCSNLMDPRGTGFREAHGLPSGWPTFPDAEVQVMNPVHPDYLLGAWVETPEHGNQVRKAFVSSGRDHCDVVVQPFEPRICRKPYWWG
ncbi:DarT ssDNA thymidine ADP-ribosyltransferase family protein [Ruixingdingia sedimenti]|nr:DarT ssDNA thymidine ADP-ribosyltransferase family protein [Xinfangfangia sp. LG-4]